MSFESHDIDKITTAEDLLALLRSGNKKDLVLSMGDFKYPCRLLNAQEEAITIVKAKQQAMFKNPQRIDMEVFESLECMKAILIAALTPHDGVKIIPDSFFEALTKEELVPLYDQYQTMCKTLNPSVSDMTQEQIIAIVQDVKKKNTQVSSYYTWELAGVGKYFLERILPFIQTDKDSGV